MGDRQRKESTGIAGFSEVLGVDLRTLALFRIALALVVLGDIVTRSTDLTAHYTDAGVLRRSDLVETFQWLHAWPPCLHLVGGALWSQVVLFAAHALCAVALLVGYRTRLATFLVWLFTMSVQLRNLYIGHGSDAELRMMLFWGWFLPLGARYSVDSVLRPAAQQPEREQYLSVGTVAVVVQLVILYLSTGYAKLQYPNWAEGNAVASVLNNDLWATSAGLVLLQFPGLCRLLTRAVLYLELVGPLLLLVPVFFGPLRTATVIALSGMHLGFAAGLRVGIFPWVSISAVLFFIPGWFWEHLMRRLRTADRLGVKIYVQGACLVCRRRLLLFRTFFLLPETPIVGMEGDDPGWPQGRAWWSVIDSTGARYTQYDAFLLLCRVSPLLWPLASLLRWAAVRRWGESLWAQLGSHGHPHAEVHAEATRGPASAWRQWLREGLCAAFLAYVIFWNVGVVRDREFEAPPWIAWLGSSFLLQQDWRMFAAVAERTGWVVIPGTLMDGTQVDLFRDGGPLPELTGAPGGGAVSFEKPANVSYRVKNYRWLGFTDRLAFNKRGDQQLQLYGRYLCREWNRAHEGAAQLNSLEIYFLSRPVHPEYHSYSSSDYEKILLWTHWCFR